MLLLIIAAFGLIVPNGLFIYYTIYEFDSVAVVLQNKLAIAFIIDVFMVLGILSVYFHKKPIGRIGWPWFVVLSLIGGLGFSLPLYWWLNQHMSETVTQKLDKIIRRRN